MMILANWSAIYKIIWHIVLRRRFVRHFCSVDLVISWNRPFYGDEFLKSYAEWVPTQLQVALVTSCFLCSCLRMIIIVEISTPCMYLPSDTGLSLPEYGTVQARPYQYITQPLTNLTAILLQSTSTGQLVTGAQENTTLCSYGWSFQHMTVSSAA